MHTRLAFAPNGRTLAIGKTDLYRLELPARPFQDKSWTGGGSRLDNERWAPKSYAEFLKIVDLASGEERVLRGHTAGISGLAYAPDSRLLATAGDDRSVRLWDPDTGKEQLVLRGHVDGVSALAFAPDSSFLVTAGHDGAIKRWDLGALRENNILTGHSGWVLALAFSPDGTKLVSAGTAKLGTNFTIPGEVKVWDVASGRELDTLPSRSLVVSADFSPDGSTLATYTGAGDVTLFDLSTKKVTTNLKGGAGYPAALRFLGDGKGLVTCAAREVDGVSLWDLATCQKRTLFKSEGEKRR